MVEHGHRPGLAGEAFGERRVLPDLGREDLQGHEPVEPLLPGLVDHAHAAAAHQFQDLQVGKCGAKSAGVGGSKSAFRLPPRRQRGRLQPLLEKTVRA